MPSESNVHDYKIQYRLQYFLFHNPIQTTCTFLIYMYVYMCTCNPSSLQPPRDACICEEAAIWCAKLLPFSEFLLKRKNDFKVEDLVLSVFLELPCSTFAADLLAYSFPGACFNQNRNLDAKMKRLLTRLRSTADVADSLADGGRGAAQSEPLSVRYQSTSQRILTTQESLGTKVGKFRVLISEASGSSSPGATLVESALEVGTFLHERDEDYASFCDTLFSVICPSEDTHRPSSSGRVSRQLVGETPPLPCLGHYCSMIANPDSSLTCWEQVLPLLTRLNDWSQSGTTSGSHPTIGRRPSLLHSELGNSWNSRKLSGLLRPSKKQKKAAAKRKLSECGGLQGSVMRVNLSPPFIINCLQVREENEVMKATKKSTTCTPTRPPAGPASVPPSPSPFTRSSFTEHEISTNRSLHLADLEKSTADATAESGSQRGRIEATEQDVSRLGDQSTLGLKATEEDRGGSSGLSSLPLLQVPEGVLHVSCDSFFMTLQFNFWPNCFTPSEEGASQLALMPTLRNFATAKLGEVSFRIKIGIQRAFLSLLLLLSLGPATNTSHQVPHRR